MNTIKTIGWIVLTIIFLGVVKLFFFATPKTNSPSLGSTGKGGEMPPVLVNVFIPIAQELNNEVFATGSVLANEEAILIPEIAGKVIRLNINEGRDVKKGELLVKINDADFQAQLKKLELQAKIADDQVNRQKQLLAISGISQEEFDITLNQLNTIKADIDYVKAQISKTEIRAPFNGVVGLKYISEGSYVNNTTRIASIQQINAVKIDFSVPEKYADVIRKNDMITFTVSDNDKIYKAKVYAIEPKIDLNTRTLQLRAIAENKGDLYPGAFAKIKLPLQTIKNAVMIPTEAIIPILKGKKVFICKNGKAVEVKVQTGIRTDALIQIVSGISSGDSVITTGIMQLKPDAPVKVIQKK
jgi:membrane fusion protein (multidrug efflux system)